MTPLTENQSAVERREKANAYHRERYANDPEFRKKTIDRTKARYRQQMQENPEAVRAAARERMAKRRARLKGDPQYRASIKKHRDASRQRAIEFVNGIKDGTPCADCGQTFDPIAMDFDHVRGEKNDNVGSMVARGVALDRIQAEIDKCELVCANCHRVRTADRLSNEDIDISEVIL